MIDVRTGENGRESPACRESSEASLDPERKTSPISPSGIALHDLLNKAIAGMFARPGRMALTILGIIIGLTALIATLGLSRTAGNRIISQFDKLAST